MKADDVIGLLKEAKVAEALEAVEKVEDKKEMAQKLTLFAGTLNYLKDRPAIAEVLLKRSLFLDYANPLTHYNLGALFTTPPQLEEDGKNLERGVKAYKNALRFDPNFLEARYNLALLYYFSGRVQEAREEYDRIVAAVGDDKRFRELGVLLLNRKRLEESD